MACECKGGYRNNKKGGLKGGLGLGCIFCVFNPGLYTIFTSLIHLGRLCSTKIMQHLNYAALKLYALLIHEV